MHTASSRSQGLQCLSIRIPSVNRYVINGNWVRSASGTYHAAGTAIFYKNPIGLMTHQRSQERTQRLTAQGPLTEDLELMAMFENVLPEITSKFCEKLSVAICPRLTPFFTRNDWTTP
ncbi:ADAMTS-like protein 4 [Nymphon striatum]|nr:ADAMTS-like protein 4 [Nymphon striatum]